MSDSFKTSAAQAIHHDRELTHPREKRARENLEHDWNAGLRFGNQRKAVAKDKVSERRRDRKRLNVNSIVLEDDDDDMFD